MRYYHASCVWKSQISHDFFVTGNVFVCTEYTVCFHDCILLRCDEKKNPRNGAVPNMVSSTAAMYSWILLNGVDHDDPQ